MKKILIHVEGESDKYIISHFLNLIGVGDQIEYNVHLGKNHIKNYIKYMGNNLLYQNDVSHFVLIDSDEYNVPDSIETAKKQLGIASDEIKVFCAVPCIEAWLFADNKNLIERVNDKEKKKYLSRLPLPETIPYPKQVFFNLFVNSKKKSSYFNNASEIINSINIDTAISRSPSLRVFLNAILEELNEESIKYEKFLKNSIPRDVFATLLQELPKEKIVWKTLDGNVLNALELSKEIEEGTDLGKQYISDLLRIARDMLARKAVK